MSNGEAFVLSHLNANMHNLYHIKTSKTMVSILKSRFMLQCQHWKFT